MRRLLLCAVASALILSVHPAAAQKVAGTFVGTATGLPDPIHFVVTFDEDGGFVSSDSTDFGFGGLGSLQSNQHGVWKRTGQRQITIRSIFLSHDAGTGALTAIARNTSVLNFDPNFSEGTGTITVEVFLPSQILDPLNPNTDEEPLGGVLVLDATAKRLVEVGGDGNDDNNDQ